MAETASIAIEDVPSVVYLAVFQAASTAEEEPNGLRKQPEEGVDVLVNESDIHEKRVPVLVLFNLFPETKERDKVLFVVYKLLSSMLVRHKQKVVNN